MKVTKRIQGIIKFVEAQIDRGVLPEEVRPFVAEAKKGHYDTIQAFDTYESHKNRNSTIAENVLCDRLSNIRFPLSMTARNVPQTVVVYNYDPATPVEEGEEPLSNDRLFEILRKRIDNIQRPQEMTPEKFAGHLLKELGFAAGSARRRAREKVARGLARKMAQQILSATRQQGALHMLPSPSSEGPHPLKSIFASTIGAREDVMLKWREWAGWPIVLTNVFAAYLAEGRITRSFPSLVDRRKTEMALRKAWYNDISAVGMSSEDVGQAIQRMYRQDKVEERARAVAEYSRYDKSVLADLERDGASVKRLYYDMLALHRDDPLMDGKDFLALLTPYIVPLTITEISKALKRTDAPLDALQRFAAQNILAWHTYNPQGLAGMLAGYILDNNMKTCPDINSFCEKKLGFSRGMISLRGAPAPFVKKLEQMADAGVDLKKLLKALDEKFPGAIDPIKARELARIAKEKRAGALAMDIATPKPTAATYAATDAPSTTVRTRGNGPRRLRRRGTTDGAQLSLNLTAKYRMDGGIENYMIAGRRLPMFPGPRTMMNMGLNLMHLKNI